MSEHQASRTLVKSAPELWAECSEAASLAKHLGAFGEIRITRLEPETAVAWEGDAARGTVRLEPAGWGTRVILTAQEGDEPTPPAVEVPVRAVEVPDPPRRGMLSRVFFLRPRRGGAAPDAPAPAPGPVGPYAELLDEALHSLGRAHHRPYSRS